jgi:phospholipid-binding lipoprotein MlaA
MTQLRARHAAFIMATAMLAACSTVRTPSKSDPFEGFNRTVFTVNDKLDTAIVKPAAQAYTHVVPQPVRSNITNFFSNVGDVYIAANNLLQGKIAAGTEDIMRVVINTIFGVGGIYDVATLARLPKHHADFGLTLGHYGVPAGPYLVLPLLGPSTLRDAAGFLVDQQADPTSYIDPAWARVALYGVRLLNVRASLLNASDLLSDAALDKYSFVRNAYLQRRQYLLYDGNPPPPTYEDDLGDQSDSNAGTGGAAAAGAAAGGLTAVPTPASGAVAQPPAGASSAVGASGAAAPAPASGARRPGDAATGVPPSQMMPPGNYFQGFRLR